MTDEYPVVVVRDNMAGVFVGRLARYDGATRTARLVDARKVHWWSRAAAVEGLATSPAGPGEGSRITPVVPWVEVCAVVQVVGCTPEGARALMEAPVWAP